MRINRVRQHELLFEASHAQLALAHVGRIDGLLRARLLVCHAASLVDPEQVATIEPARARSTTERPK